MAIVYFTMLSWITTHFYWIINVNNCVSSKMHKIYSVPIYDASNSCFIVFCVYRYIRAPGSFILLCLCMLGVNII